MTCITINEFGGLNKQLSPRNMGRVQAQIAHNCLLTDGVLRPMPQWVPFKVLPEGTYNEDNWLYEDSRSGRLLAAIDFRNAVYITGAPFADNILVGVDGAGHTLPLGINTNVYVAQNGDSINGLRPIGLPTPTFGDYITSVNLSYIPQYHSKKPVNRVIGITFCRLTASGLEESTIAVLPSQSPYEVMYEGDIIALALDLDLSLLALAKVTHVRLYRTISGLDTGEQVANELDTDWHLIATLGVSASISYNDGGAVTTDPMDLYLANHFYPLNFLAAHFGLSESGWFYAASTDGRIAMSERYLHHAWPTENKVRIPEAVIDVVESYDTLFVGTETRPYVIALGPGEGEQGLQAAAIPGSERLPCLSRTMVAAPGGALYASPTGLVAASKSGLKVLTEGILNPGDTLYKNTDGDITSIGRTTLGAYYGGDYYGFCSPVSDEGSTPTVVPEPVDPLTYMAWQLAEFSGSVSGRHVRTAYATFDEATKEFITLATIDHAPAHGSTGTAGFMMDGDLIVKVWTDQTSTIPEQVSGVYALRYDGTATLQQLDHWRMSALQYDMYSDIVRYSDTEIAVIHADPGGDATIRTLGYANGVFTEVGAPLVIDTPRQFEYVATLHNGHVIVLCHTLIEAHRFLAAYSWNGSAWTLVATYGGTLAGTMDPGSGMLVSDGSFLYLPTGHILTYNGSAFTLITDIVITGYGKKIAAFDGHFVLLEGTTPLKVYSFDGASTTLVDTIPATIWGWATYGGAWASPEGIYLLPSDTVENIDKSGIFEWNGTDLVRLGPLQFDNDDRARTPVITIIDLHAKLVEA
jgi:hypothetical protein